MTAGPLRGIFAGTILAAIAVIQAPTSGADGDKAPVPVQVVAPEGDGGKYWPRWRGPNQGVVPDGKYPDKWSDTENVLWKIEVPGVGHSSPIIWKDRIFLTTGSEDGTKRFIVCLNRADGKLLWQTAAPDAKPEAKQKKNSYASGTPCTDGERVYAYFGNHGLLCVDFEGKKVWHHAFGPMDAYHGMSCSPLLYKDRIIVFQDHRSQSGSFVAAYDKKTGNELWKTPRKEKVGWGSPIAIRAGDRDEIIVSSEHRVYAYDPASGKEIWSCAGNFVEVTPTPVVGHNLLFCCSGRSGPTLAIKGGGTGDVTKTHIEWKTGTGSPFIPSPLVYGDYIYMVNDILSVGRCFEAKTGTEKWKERLGNVVKEGFSSSLVGVNGKVFFTNDQGDTFVVEAGPAFKLLHTNKLKGRTLASPALLDDKWYWRTDTHLYCIGAKE